MERTRYTALRVGNHVTARRFAVGLVSQAQRRIRPGRPVAAERRPQSEQPASGGLAAEQPGVRGRLEMSGQQPHEPVQEMLRLVNVYARGAFSCRAGERVVSSAVMHNPPCVLPTTRWTHVYTFYSIIAKTCCNVLRFVNRRKYDVIWKFYVNTMNAIEK